MDDTKLEANFPKRIWKPLTQGQTTIPPHHPTHFCTLNLAFLYLAQILRGLGFVPVSLKTKKCPLDGDTIAIFMFSTIHLSFQEIQHQIDRINIECLKLGKGMTKSKLKDLCHLISQIRNQAALTNQIIGPAQAIHVFMLFTLLVLSLYLFFDKTVMQADLPANVDVKTLLCCFGFVRMFVKAIYVDSVRKEEKRLATKMLELECDSLAASIERKLYADYLTCNPTKFVLADLLEFNRSFMLTCIGNVTTYLVVLLQFNELSRS
ncbi:unnamed protein product [Orchesella dallaii]|uniref:Gustatory receptor n=1 Tax=Orchesella dallaii TaxID=48710 RepID=A0ABP1PZB6_9HEXA